MITKYGIHGPFYMSHPEPVQEDTRFSTQCCSAHIDASLPMCKNAATVTSTSPPLRRLYRSTTDSRPRTLPPHDIRSPLGLLFRFHSRDLISCNRSNVLVSSLLFTLLTSLGLLLYLRSRLRSFSYVRSSGVLLDAARATLTKSCTGKVAVCQGGRSLHTALTRTLQKPGQ